MHEHFDLFPARERAIVDSLSVIWEDSGLPPVTGRILGRLLMAQPSHQSSTQLADYVRASAGAVSTATRMLITIGLIERVRFPGDRASYFRVKPNCWNEIMNLEVLRYARLRRVAQQGVELLEEMGETHRADRVQEFHKFAAFIEDELPLLLRQWDQRQEPPK